ncbi:MAG: SAM-dependent methyltransferase [Mycobacteriales bacterium]
MTGPAAVRLAVPPAGPDAIATHFDRLHAEDDPWSVRTSWYEIRKAAIVLASLPRGRYALAWEPGCSIGGLTGRLSLRCDRVLAADASPRAVGLARTATAGLPHVSVIEAVVPRDLPALQPASTDLVVLSEFLYYVPPTDVAGILDIAAGLQPAGGHLVCVHWRPLPHDAWQSGVQVNAQVAADDRWRTVVAHADEDFVLDVRERR